MNEQPMRILVVDDDRRIVRTTCDILRLKGHESIAVFSGEQAIRQVETELPDCVLMDVKMPGISGVEALQIMHRVAPQLPVVLASACATDEVVAEAKRAGAYAVLSKPVDFQQILSFLSLLRKQENILVVDDDPQFCKTLSDVLRLRGYRVETETRPAQVLRHLDDDYQLMVVLDLKLGASDGLDVLQAIRERYPTKPVLLVTGYREQMAAAIEQGRRIGAYTCLYKPFETEVLLQIVGEISQMKQRAALERTATLTPCETSPRS